MAEVNLDDNSSIGSDGESESVADNMTMLTLAKIDSKEAIATINGVTVFNPSSIVDLFCLPESYQSEVLAFVVITLDSPICLGETPYPHIVMQFGTGCEIKNPLYRSIELLKYKFKDGLESLYSSGLIHGFFTKALSALSSTKITRPGVFRSIQDGSYAVKCDLKAGHGILYPLAECLFFLPEPPTLVHHKEIRCLQLRKKVRGSERRHFYLIVTLMTEHNHIFWNIQRSEYYNLKEYFSNTNLEFSTESDGDCSPFDKFGDPSDDSGDDSSDTDGEQEMYVERQKRRKKSPKHDDYSHMRLRIHKEPNAPKAIMSAFLFFSESERENVRKENPGITFTDIGKIMGEKWRNMSAAEREPYEAKAQADRKRYLDEIGEYYHPEPDNMASRYLTKVQVRKSRYDEDGDFITISREVGSSAASDSDDNVDDSSSADENRLKLGKGMVDPNTPTSPMVAFLCFSRAELENAKKENPSATFTDIGKILEEKWSNMSAAEKEPYEAMAQADRQRYIPRK